MEAKYTSLLAYVQLAHIETLKIINDSQEYRRELTEEEIKQWRRDLEPLATVPWPGFSAAGFFCVDNALLFGLLGSITSYVIVLIQLADFGLET